MTAFLGRTRNTDLIKLCDELLINVIPDSKILQITNLILDAAEYVEPFFKAVLQRITKEKENEYEEQEKQRETEEQ